MPPQVTDVCVTQEPVAQSARAITAVAVVSVEAKLMPVSVTLAMVIKDATFCDAAVMTGAVGVSSHVLYLKLGAVKQEISQPWVRQVRVSVGCRDIACNVFV